MEATMVQESSGQSVASAQVRIDFGVKVKEGQEGNKYCLLPRARTGTVVATRSSCSGSCTFQVPMATRLRCFQDLARMRLTV